VTRAPEQGPDAAALAAAVAALAGSGRIPLGDLPVEPASLGLASDGTHAWLPDEITLLDADTIRAALNGRTRAWLQNLEVHRVIGSTSTLLAERSGRRSIDGHVCLAEVQLAGRGRRGRRWLSPLGGNLAVSLGFGSRRPAGELGGLSLVVGLAVLDALESLGVAGLGLKWPNDLLLGDAKLAGILIELLQQGPAVSFTVGIGINVRLPDAARTAVDQPVADLAGCPSLPDRSRLAAAVISSVTDFVGEFQELGFEPFRAAFDARHRLHGEAATVSMTGAEPVSGRVLGVSEGGGIRLATDAGDQVFHGGEISLRRAP